MIKTKMFSKNAKTAAFLASALVFSVSLSYVVLAANWTEPTAPAPGNNVDLPLNIGATGQVKLGGLTLNVNGAPNGLIVNKGNVRVDEGNVGIGTTTPASTLSIRGAAGKVGTGTISGAGVITGVGTKFLDEIGVGSRITAAGQTKIIKRIVSDTSIESEVFSPALPAGTAFTYESSIVNFSNSAGANRFAVSSKGNLMLGDFGTKTPYITGSDDSLIAMSGKNMDMNATSSSDGYSDKFDFDIFRSRGTPENPTIVNNTLPNPTELGWIGFGAYNGNGYVSRLGRFGAVMDSGTVSATSLPVKLVFSTTPDGTIAPVERMTIKSDGNVGIGTATPAAKLDVVGDEVLVQDGSPEINFIDSDVGDINWRFGGGTGSYLGVSAQNEADWNNTLGWGVVNRYTGGGNVNVGIGTNSPNAKLDVRGNVSIGSGAAQANKALCWRADKTIGYCSTQPDATGSCTCNAIN
ncbi:MAG: hypothetical protein WC788_02480 [Candidatus Paceibacterota bacterium]|jgi:hypothetical protein